MEKNKVKDIRNKILKGLDLAIKKLIQAKLKNNDELVFSDNGKIIRIKAQDLIN